MSTQNFKLSYILELCLAAYRGAEEENLFMCNIIDRCRNLTRQTRKDLKELIKEAMPGEYTLSKYLEKNDPTYASFTIDSKGKYNVGFWRNNEALEYRINWYENLIREMKEKNL